MSLQDRALPIPQEIEAAPDNEAATEMARVWWDGSRPKMVIRPMLKNPEAVGVLLAEMSWHFSNVYARAYNVSQPEAMKAIQNGWTSAQARAAAQPQGEVVQ